MNISVIAKNYFHPEYNFHQAIHDIDHRIAQLAIGILKVFSYFLIVPVLFFGLVLAAHYFQCLGRNDLDERMQGVLPFHINENNGQYVPQGDVETTYQEYNSRLRNAGIVLANDNHLAKFKRIELIISGPGSHSNKIRQLRQAGLGGYLHIEQWNPHELMANIRMGIHLLHQQMQTSELTSITKVLQESHNPCFHAFVESLQALALNTHQSVFLFSVNFDPMHTPLQRASELVRVYRNQRAEVLLKARGEEPSQNNIDKLDHQEIPHFTRENVLQWCKENKYIGYDTCTVKAGPFSSTILSKVAAENAIDEVFKALCI